jgi:hypothetical protein
MTMKNYDRLANLCVFVLVVTALMADHFPEYKWLFAVVAGGAALAASISYLRAQWFAIDEKRTASTVSKTMADSSIGEIEVDVGTARVISRHQELNSSQVVLSRLQEIIIDRVLATSEEISISEEITVCRSGEEELAEYMRQLIQSAPATALPSVHYGRPHLRSKVSKRSRIKNSAYDARDLLAA